MMKQPAENANATTEEVRTTQTRALPIFHNSPEITAEIAKLAYQHWQQRGGLAGSAEEDWLRAEEIIRNRLRATRTA